MADTGVVVGRLYLASGFEVGGCYVGVCVCNGDGRVMSRLMFRPTST